MTSQNRTSSSRIGAGQTVDLVTEIKRLIRSYPGGLGLIKELIQNADDAGARTVQITLDWRVHTVSDLPEPEMERFLGPSLLLFNDAVFNERDFDAIQAIGRGSKKTALTKAGRFGLGFNSVYHITDYPSFASSDRVLFFDPHRSVFRQGGEGWLLEDGEISNYLNLYNSGLADGYTLNNSTVFRLPLRVDPQETEFSISKTIFGDLEKNNFKQELFKVSEELLIFLKSVDEIGIYEIPEGSSSRRIELLKVTTTNKQEVFESRQKLISVLQDNSGDLLRKWRTTHDPLPPVSYLHRIETDNQGQKHSSLWRVCNVIRLDEQGEMIEAIEDMAKCEEKAVPWAGAAARILTSKSDQDDEPLEGQAYCFLPLNFATGLPVHVHGFFDIDEARTDLTREIKSADERRKTRAKWNLLLVEHVLSHAYAHLLTELVDDIGSSDASRFYDYFPISTSNEALSHLPSYVVELLQDKRVIRSTIKHPNKVISQGNKKVISSTHWVSPEEISILPYEWEKLLDPLRKDKVDIADPPLPKAIREIFSQSGFPFSEFLPSDLRDRLYSPHTINLPLEVVDRDCLSKREWILNLLEYCLKDGCKDLVGLPLAILADGTLQSFGYSPCGFIYSSELALRDIFDLLPQWFLDIDVENRFPSIGLCHGVDWMTPVEVAKRLKDLIDPSSDGIIDWEPEGNGIPNSTWLSKIYNYFSDKKPLPYKELQEVPLVPCNDGYLYQGGNSGTPLWCDSSTFSNTLEALKYFNVPLVEANTALKDAIERLINLHPEKLIWKLTVPDLIDTLEGIEELPLYNEEFYKELVSFLAEPRWIKGSGRQDTARQKSLRNLSIYPTTDNTPSDLQNAYIPASEPPRVAGSLKLLQLGPEGEWKRLFKLLGVPELNHARMIEHLVKAYNGLNREEQLEALIWIRDKLSQAQTELENETSNSLGRPNLLKKLIRESALIRCTDGKLRAAKELYHPKNIEVVRQILGYRAYSPDMDFYSRNSKHWRDFFRDLGMMSSPSADDIVEHVDKLVEEARQGLTPKIESSLMDVYQHLESNWGRLNKATVERENLYLPEALKKRAWLPARRDENALKEVPGAFVPPARLYRADEVDFFANRFRVASQRPLFSQGKLPEADFYEPLGFSGVPAHQTVVDHFKSLIDLWSSPESSRINEKNFQTSIQSIYNHFSTYFVRATNIAPPKVAWLQNQLAGYRCLWDYADFWLPQYAFQESVPFFGTYRAKICPSPLIRDVYELLGQKRVPDLEDFLTFVDEIAEESSGNPLNEDQTCCITGVLKEIDWLLERESISLQGTELLLLTDDRLLLPPDQALIPDAPLRLQALKDDRSKCKVLHDQVPHRLAIEVGCPSLLEDVCQAPTAKVGADDVEANLLCQQWQNLLRSEYFQLGLERLILHEYGLIDIDLSWLRRIRIVPVDQILTNLIFKGEIIASDVPCDQYFDTTEQAIYLVVNDESVMAYRLAESLNYELSKEEFGGWPLNDTSKLVLILGFKRFSKIDGLLTSLGVRALKKSDVDKPTEPTELVEDQIFDDDIGEDLDDDLEHQTGTQSSETTVAKSRNASTGTASLKTPETVASTAPTDRTQTETGGSSAEVSHPKITSDADNSEVDDHVDAGEIVEDEHADSNTEIEHGVSSSSGNERKLEQSRDAQIPESATSSSDTGQMASSSRISNRTNGTSQSGASEIGATRFTFEDITQDDLEEEVEEDDFSSDPKSRDGTQDISSEQENTFQNSSETLRGPGRSRSFSSGQRRVNSQSGQGTPRSKNSQTYRNGVRVRSESVEDSSPDPEEQVPEDIREKIDRLGTQLVLAYEIAQGRTPRDMNDLCDNHPGYDIESNDADDNVRYIEVKSLRGDWGRRGVKVTRTQFEMGKNYADQYWLYVVERVEDKPRLFTIQDPVKKVGEFYYDDSWQQLAKISAVSIEEIIP